MNRLMIVFVLFLSIAACQPPVKKVPPIATEDFFKDPEKVGFRISPNGEMIIYRGPHMGRMNVFVQKLEIGRAHV